MTNEKPEKPTKEYAAAVAAECSQMFTEYLQVIAGQKTMTAEERKAWNEKKDKLLEETRRVRGLI